MPTSPLRPVVVAVVGSGAVLVALVLGATPAAAHALDGGALPAPPWLLAYLGGGAVLATAGALRSSWTGARLAATDLGDDVAPPGAPWRWPAIVGAGVGVALFAATLSAALVGPDSPAGNIAPVTVFVVWWVGLPLLCLVAGDVMRAVNPFAPVVALLERLRPADPSAGRRAPTWTAAAFLAGFSWFFLAYHRPGSPRAVAVLLAVYGLAAVGGGLWWGRKWLRWGEGFGAVSAAVAHLTRPRTQPPPPGLVALAVVWLGATAFDGVSATSFWVDVQGTTRGWGRTAVNSVGLLWVTAMVAVLVLAGLRVCDRGPRRGAGTTPSSHRVLGIALLPVALAWFLTHYLTFLLFEGQNFVALASDPLGRGWDLFGTINRTIDYSVVEATWVRWAQLGMLLVGHVGAVVLAHDGALRHAGRRSAMRVTWTATALAVASVAAAALLVLG